MVNKRGQVTIFIIIAIILIAAVSLYFIFKDKIDVSSQNVATEPIVNFVQECIDQTFEDSLIAVANQGGYSGYSYVPRKITNSGVSYYLTKQENYFPSKDFVEEEISEYVERNYFLCALHFIDFPEYEVKEGNLEVFVDILDKKVILDIDYPLTIRKGGGVSRVENFESEINVRLGLVYDSVYDFIDQQRNYEEGVCLSCLDIATENDIYVEMSSYYNETIIFTFIDEKSKLNNEPLEWVFANEN